MTAPTLRIELDDLTRAEVHALLAEHLTDMHATSPPESVHALDLSALRAAEVTFWTVWQDAELLGCGALSQPFFAPARELYLRHGFTECAPFADYAPDPNSVFLIRAL